MKGHIYKPNCKCPKGKKCKCGAKWGFLVDVGVNPKTGRRKQKFKGGFKTRKEAEKALTKFLAEIEQETYIEESELTFEQFSKQWISMYESTGKVKVSTIRIRKHEIMRLKDYFAKLKLKSITRKKYQDALNDLKKRGYAENTISGIHGTGRMIFKKAMEMELIKKDPTEFAVVPTRQKTVEELEQTEIPKYLEKEELALFLKTAKEKGLVMDYVIFLTLAYTGMRIGELGALKWNDVNFTEKTISITKTLNCPNNNSREYHLLTPKTNTSVRTIDVDDEIISELEKHRAFQNKIRMRYRDRYHDQNFIFAMTNSTHAGYPLYPKLFLVRMKRLLKLSELDLSLTPHSLRHTHTSLLAEAGVNLETIMERLGHKDDNVTRSVYLHITKSQKKEASHKFSELMRNLR